MIRQLEKQSQLINRVQRKKSLARKSVISYKFERTTMWTSEDLVFPHTHQTHDTWGQIQRSLTQAWHLLVLYGCRTLWAWAPANPLWPVCLNDPPPIYNSHNIAGCSHFPPRCQQHNYIAKSVMHRKLHYHCKNWKK